MKTLKTPSPSGQKFPFTEIPEEKNPKSTVSSEHANGVWRLKSARGWGRQRRDLQPDGPTARGAAKARGALSVASSFARA